jgi:hypothetical protein
MPTFGGGGKRGGTDPGSLRFFNIAAHVSPTMNHRTPPDRDQNAPSSSAPANQGEGNRTADRRYREATREFVDSERGRKAMRDVGELSDEEQRDIENAEQQAKQRAKEHDPAERRNPSKPAT